MSESEERSQGVVVVGVDGSACSDHAVAWAEAYCRRTGQTMRLVSAWDLVMGYGPYMAIPSADLENTGREVLAKARAQVSLPEHQVETRLVHGIAQRVLVEESAEADLLVVGSKGHNPLVTIVMGSVSAHCAHHAQCPLVIVR